MGFEDSGKFEWLTCAAAHLIFVWGFLRWIQMASSFVFQLKSNANNSIAQQKGDFRRQMYSSFQSCKWLENLPPAFAIYYWISTKKMPQMSRMKTLIWDPGFLCYWANFSLSRISLSKGACEKIADRGESAQEKHWLCQKRLSPIPWIAFSRPVTELCPYFQGNPSSSGKCLNLCLFTDMHFAKTGKFSIRSAISQTFPYLATPWAFWRFQVYSPEESGNNFGRSSSCRYRFPGCYLSLECPKA